MHTASDASGETTYIPSFVRPEVLKTVSNKNMILWNMKPLSIIDG